MAAARIDLQTEELMRIDILPVELGCGFLAAERFDRVDDFALQPLHQFQRDIEKIARAAGRIEHASLAQFCIKIDRQRAHLFMERVASRIV